tara:strand:- start:7487 stop:8845 length:1359 start_codon:yes stop_codon:yes gene_type:complete
METNITKNLHFIAIGGSAMHNLAIALSRSGNKVSGSDDQIFEPSRSRLKKEGLLPKEEGWFPEKIAAADGIVLGMHAKTDNPELLEAKRLNKDVMSYPEFLGQCFENDFRVVIAGSHGKTTITSMVLHVLHQLQQDVKYMVGAQLEGFDCMVKLHGDVNTAIIEGDEYLSSPIDRRSKFLWYKPNLAIITGIAWDHFNVFKTEESYIQCFVDFIKSMEPKGTVVYFEEDKIVEAIKKADRADLTFIPYSVPNYTVENGEYQVVFDDENYPLSVIGKHNMSNVEGARLLANKMGVDSASFFEALSDFGGAAKRLEPVTVKGIAKAYRDFAHAPSKVTATVAGVREAYPDKNIVVFLELHTYSSLNPEFIKNYAKSLDPASKAYVYYDKRALEIKQMEALNPSDVKAAFSRPDMEVLTEKDDLSAAFAQDFGENAVVLFLSSGNFGGMLKLEAK